MKTLLLSALIFLPALIGGQEAKASFYNPYESSYKQWNTSYGVNSSPYRRKLEQYNPYRNSYKDWNRTYGY